jgi:hypothetical protein
MAYTIDTYSNSRSWRIEDGTIDQTTDLKLVGKNYAGYGEIQNENFVFLLENFAGQSEPPRKVSGQIWFDTGNSKLKFYDGIKWRTTGGAEVSAAVPTGLKIGDFWWDSSNEQLYTYNGGDFVLIGPQSAGSGQTQIVSRSVRDDGGTSRGIITAVVNDETIFTVSSQDFTIDTGDVDSNIPGFDRIHQGLTLKNTLNSSGGVTSGDFRLWGTAANSEKLGGELASAYVKNTTANFAGLARFSDVGLQVGDSGDLKLKIELDSKAVIANETGLQIEFRAKNNLGSILNPMRIFADAVIPGFVVGTELTTPVVAATTLGTEDYKWPTVYANNFNGLASISSSLNVGTYNAADPLANARYPSTSSAANTVAIRDANGDLYANFFQGIATEAQYADLAEKYTTDQEYPVGTVMAVCDHEDHETEAAHIGKIAIGVISTAPAYLMNKDCDGQAIGLKGRVPVRVVGAVKKGHPVYVHDNGCASTEVNGGSLVGIALETNDSLAEKLVECVLKV